ncbi:MAG: hypothetical protein FWC61_02815 [Proteobacteria bacterium]|nr:hypothetical protein [Pseudomonadota bacterium]
MPIDQILQLLKNSGFHVISADADFIFLEDPSCFLRSLSDFMDVAWIALAALTGVLIFGWAVAMVRGAQNNIIVNLRNLIIIFGILAAAKPAVNVIWGDDLFATGCKRIQVSVSEINRVLAARDAKLGGRYDDNAEVFDIWDSARGDEYTDAMRDVNMNAAMGGPPDLAGAGAPQKLYNVQVFNGGNEPAAAANSSPAPAAAAAMADGNDVIYVGADGRRFRRTGGTRSWKNNNPGNIRYSEFSRAHGAIGQAGGFSVFPNEQTGMSTIRSLLQTRNYQSLTVAGAINRWAPPSENDTAAYQRRLEQLTGIPINTPMQNLDGAQLERVANAIRTVEGWRPGREVPL